MAFLLLDPDSTLDYTLDFSDWLDSGVIFSTVTTPVWTITPTGPTLANQSNTTTASTIYVSSATLGVVYRLSCVIVTDAATAQTVERTIMIRCAQR